MAQIASAFFGLGLDSLDCLFLNAAVFPAFLAMLGAGMLARDILARRALARRLARYTAEARAARISAEISAALEFELNACLAELNR